jgi:hypothetical protein
VRNYTVLAYIAILAVTLISSIQITHVVGAQSVSISLESNGKITATIFSKTIMWSDNSSELVQIDAAGNFLFNGSQQNVTGFVFATGTLEGDFVEPQNVALINKEFTYLQSHGVRLVDINMGWGFWVYPLSHPDGIKVLLDAAFKCHLLVSIELDDHFNKEFDCSIDRLIVPGRTYSQWFNDFWDIAKNYSNIVAFSLENEIDEDGRFNSQQVGSYMTWLYSVVSNETSLPTYTKLVPYFGNSTENTLKKVILNLTCIPCIDPYATSVADMNSLCSSWAQFLMQNGKSSEKWWVGETNKMNHQPPNWELDTTNYTPDFLEALFENKASLVTLYPMNYPSQPTWPFFDANGDPVPALQSLQFG